MCVYVYMCMLRMLDGMHMAKIRSDVNEQYTYMLMCIYHHVEQNALL